MTGRREFWPKDSAGQDIVNPLGCVFVLGVILAAIGVWLAVGFSSVKTQPAVTDPSGAPETPRGVVIERIQLDGSCFYVATWNSSRAGIGGVDMEPCGGGE